MNGIGIRRPAADLRDGRYFMYFVAQSNDAASGNEVGGR
jgi:hypothetical protein